jgi:hypothetical protein
MELPMIIIIVLLVVGIILALKILKGAFKIAFTIAGLVVLAVLMLIGAAYLDAKKLNSLLEEGDKVLLYQEGENIFAGVRVGENGFLIEGTGMLPEDIKVLDKTMLAEYKENISKSKTSNEELIFVVMNDSFTNLSTVTINEIAVSKALFDKIMKSDEPKKLILDESLDSMSLSELEQKIAIEAIKEQLDMFSDEELKSALFLVALNEIIEKQGESYLLRLINEEKIIIYPDFFLLSFVSMMPEKMFDKALDKALISLQKKKATGDV